MWKIVIPLPDETQTDVINAFCKTYNYQERIINPETQEEIDNPLSRLDFIQDVVAYYIMEVATNHILQEARIAAEAAARAEADAKAAAAIAWYDQYRNENS